MNSQDILSDITIYSKYARYIPEKNRRETWDEICDRNMNMHIKRFPNLEDRIRAIYDEYVRTKKVLPSMRSAQFAGSPIDINESRIFNCSYLPIDNIDAFSEIMFMLLGGNGVGFSVEEKNIKQLPLVKKPNPMKQMRFLIGDSLEGWADAIKVLIKSYFNENKDEYPIFDYRDIRPKGSELIRAGGKAPGPEPLRACINEIRNILDENNGRRLSSIYVHDIVCHIADAVLAGGIRRSALISFFDANDEAMLNAKGNFSVISSDIYYNKQNEKMIAVNYNSKGKGFKSLDLPHSEYLENEIKNNKKLPWYHFEPQRARANNSVVLKRDEVTKKQFKKMYQKTKESNAGEPGFFLTSSEDMRSNPCLSYDTPILTTDGWQQIGDLEDQTLTFINKHGDEVEGHVWKSGEKMTYEIRLQGRTGKFLVATEDHVWIDNEGAEVKTKDLKGKRLHPFFETWDFDTRYEKLGFIQGDSTLPRSGNFVDLNFGENDEDMVKMFGYEEGTRSVRHTDEIEYMKEIGFNFQLLRDRLLPAKFSQLTDIQQRSFIRGLYGANGSIEGEGRAKLTSCNVKLLEQVQFILHKYDINASIYLEKEDDNENKTWRLVVTNYYSNLTFNNLFGFSIEYKNEKLRRVLIEKAPFVSSIVKLQIEPVYDFNLNDDTHVGVVGVRNSDNNSLLPVLTHNCAEIALKPKQFCNLTEINASNVENQEDFNKRAEAAAFIGTLQASYTDFHYLRFDWKKQTREEALIGVGMTGIASGNILKLDMQEAAIIVKETNRDTARAIGINPSARTTTVKPSGTTSCVLGCSSGIHAWYDDFYIRRIRLGKNEAIATYLKEKMPELVEDDIFNPENIVVSIPQKAPEGAKTRSESAIDTLNRVLKVQREWIDTGHRIGENTHNVSVTLNVDTHEWDELFEAMWKNRDSWTGISLLPKDNGSYQQAPFESITEEEYYEMAKYIKDIDLREVKENTDNTDLKGEIACSGGQCEII